MPDRSRSSGSRKAAGSAAAGRSKKTSSQSRAGAARKSSRKTAAARGSSKASRSGASSTARRSAKKSTQGSSRNGSGEQRSRDQARRRELSAIEAVKEARARLAELLGRQVESVLGVDRDHGNWIVIAQVVELSRIPNTTDVLGEYEAVLDRNGEIVRYRRTHRYHRAQVDDGS
jgi:hypothetical protein